MTPYPDVAKWFFCRLEKNHPQHAVNTLAVFVLDAGAGIRAGKMTGADLESKVTKREYEIARLPAQLEVEIARVTKVGLLAKEATRRVITEGMKRKPRRRPMRTVSEGGLAG